MTAAPSIVGFEVADPVDAWVRAGFHVGPDAVCRIGGVGVRLVGGDRGAGLVGWSLRGLPTGVVDVDGIPTTATAEDAALGTTHPNGVRSIDHVVVLTPDLSRTVESLAAIGTRPRRERDARLGGRPMRQVFFRLGEVIVEVVGSPESSTAGPSTLWGLTHTVSDMDATARWLGERTGPVKDAVQPGRRITTLRHDDLGMSVRTALISAQPER